MTSLPASPVTRPLRVGLRIPAFDRVDQVVGAIVEAERLGFDEVWVPDSQLLWRDVFCTLTAAAMATSRITLGSAVTNVVTRHPSVIASATRTVAELAPGRFKLGLGVGNSSLAPIGLRSSTQAEMRSAVAMIRALLRGEEWPFGTRSARLRDPVPDVTVHLAATGPRNLALAGEIADGVIVLSGVAPAALSRATALMAEGVAASGREPGSVELTVSAFCHVTDDVERDARRLKPICAGIAQNGGSAFLSSVGIEVQVPEHVAGVYPDLVHAEDWPNAVEVCGQWVSDADAVRFAETFCLFGSPDHIVEGLQRTREAGATGVFLQHVGSYDAPAELMRAIARDVLPRRPA
jgi:5,10-methylenetetrahydromethanopterin reductase